MSGDELSVREQAVIDAGSEWIDDNAETLLEFLSDLVARPSMSGDEGTINDSESTVGHLWEFLEDRIDQADLEAQRIESERRESDADQRDNVYTTLPGRSERTLICTSHTDVVASGDSEAWPGDDPFAVTQGTARRVEPGVLEVEAGGEIVRSEIRDRMDRIWERRDIDEQSVLIGRGIYDNKASSVCLVGSLLALEAGLAEKEVTLDGELIHGHLVDEELYQVGVKEMVGWGDHANWLGDRLRDRDDVACVVLEGSYGFVPVVGHRGLVWITLEAIGESAHASTPELGRNAVLGMSKALAAMDDGGTDETVAERFVDDSMLGEPTVAAGTTIVGEGIRCVEERAVERDGLNSIPGWSEATFDIRIPRWEGFPDGVEGVRADLSRCIEDAAEAAVDEVDFSARIGDDDFFPPVALTETVDGARSHPLVETASASTQATFGYEPTIETAPGVTDAAFLYHGTHAPTLVEYGPAGAWSHEPWEFVEREQVIKGAKTMLKLVVCQLGVTETVPRN